MELGGYTIVRELGRGGMGAVLEGRASSSSSSSDGRRVAIKVLLRPGVRASVERFQREQRLQGALDVEGFVPVIDSGVGPSGEPFLVMPLLEGGTLRARLGEPMPVDEAVAVVRALAEALGRAHARGIIHRDLKPENVLFDAPAPGGRPFVADLGLAKHFDDAAPGASQSVALSRSGEMRGTAGYAAPEQITNARDVGPACDVFALGAILHECLTGEPAFEGDTLHELVANLVSGEREPLRGLRADVPRWLADVVDAALAVDPAARPADGAALAAALVAPAGGARPRRLALLLAVVALLVATAGVAAGLAVSRAAPEVGGAGDVAPATSADGAAATTAGPGPAAASPAAAEAPAASAPDGAAAVEAPLDEVRRLVAPPAGGRLQLARAHGSPRWATPGWAHALAAGADGRTFLVGGDHGLLLWCDAETGATRRAFPIPGGRYVTGVAYDRIGSRALAITPGVGLRVLDLERGASVGQAGGDFTAARFVESIDARVVAISATGIASYQFGGLMRPSGGSQEAELATHGGALDVVPGGLLALVGTPSGKVARWDLDRFALAGEVALGDAPVEAVVAGREQSWAVDRAGRVWRFGSLSDAPGAQVATIEDPTPDEAALLPDGRLAVSLAEAFAVRVVDLATGAVGPPMRHASDVTGLCAVAGGRLLTCDRERQRIRRWDPREARELEVPEQGGRVNGLAVLPGGPIVTGANDGKLRVLDARDGRGLRVLAELGPGPLFRVRAAPDDPSTVFASGAGAWRIPLAGWETRLQDRDGRAAVGLRGLAVAGGPTATVLTAGEDGTGRAYALDGSNRGGGRIGEGRWIYDLDLDASGAIALAATDVGARFIGVSALGELADAELASASRQRCRAVAVAPDGRVGFAGHDDGRIERIDLERREASALPVRHGGVVLALATSPDGRRVASASGDLGDDRTLRLWEARNGRELDRLDLAPLGDFVTALCWSSDGKRLFAGTARGLVLELEVGR